MTRTISLIIGIALAALVAVPTAFAEGRVGSLQPTPAPYVDAGDRGAQLGQAVVTPGAYVDATERGVKAAVTQSTPSTYVDANERSASPVTDNAGYVDAIERGSVVSTPTVVATTSTGSGFDWPQLGIGFAIGLALALGLLLAFRGTRQRPLAH